MKSTKIDWCDCTINPVIGCKNGCSYCYAERLNKRFNFIPNWKEPQFFINRLKQLNSKKPKTIFMDSMSDVSWWRPIWGEETFKAMCNNPQHAYIFLTKGGNFPSGFHEILSLQNKFDCKNIFFGRSVTKNDFCNLYWHYDFLSIEPILEPIKFDFNNNRKIKAVIIGAETGNRKGKVIPEKQWITDIVNEADKFSIKVFMKESLRNIMGDDFRQDDLPWYDYIRNN